MRTHAVPRWRHSNWLGISLIVSNRKISRYSERLNAGDVEPLRKERVPYVIVDAGAQVTLYECVRDPYVSDTNCYSFSNEKAIQAVLADRSLTINARYYVTKQLCPSLNRVMMLFGVDTLQWLA